MHVKTGRCDMMDGDAEECLVFYMFCQFFGCQLPEMEEQGPKFMVSTDMQ